MNSKNRRILKTPKIIKERTLRAARTISPDKSTGVIGDVAYQPVRERNVHEGVQSTVKGQIQKMSYAVGDGFKKAGMKLQQRGYARVGTALEKVGSNLESYGA